MRESLYQRGRRKTATRLNKAPGVSSSWLAMCPGRQGVSRGHRVCRVPKYADRANLEARAGIDGNYVAIRAVLNSRCELGDNPALQNVGIEPAVRLPPRWGRLHFALRNEKGEGGNRTRDRAFAEPGLTTWLPRRNTLPNWEGRYLKRNPLSCQRDTFQAPRCCPYTIIPAATVSLVWASMRTKLPVWRLRR